MNRSHLVKLMASALLAAGLIATPVLGARARADDLKIAVLVPQRLLASTKVGKQAAEKLKKKKDEAQKKLDGKAAEIKKMQDDLVKRAMVLSEEERRKAKDDFERQQRDASRMKEDLEHELQRDESEILGQVNDFLGKIIVDFGKDHGYDLILDASAALYFSDAPDVTDQVIEVADKAAK